MATRIIRSSSKLAPSVIVVMSWAEVKRRFGDQVLSNPMPGQRNQQDQVAHGWKHIKGAVLSSQSTLQAVVFKGGCKKGMPVMLLIDGYHRVYYWMSLESAETPDACPFSALNLEIHTITAATVEEAKLAVDTLARSYNSQDSVKRNVDFLSAAVRDAGLQDAQSVAYRVGVGSGIASYLKRVLVGESVKTLPPTPVLASRAAKAIASHGVMDMFLHAVEHSAIRRADRSRMFNPGVLEALFKRLAELEHTDMAMFRRAANQLVALVNALGRPELVDALELTSAELFLFERFQWMASIEAQIASRIGTCNREQQYNFYRDIMSVALVALGRSSLRGLKLAK